MKKKALFFFFFFLYHGPPPPPPTSEKLMGKFLRFEKEPVDQYLRDFLWNKVKYRIEKPIGELIDTLHKVSAIRVSFIILLPPPTPPPSSSPNKKKKKGR